MQLHECPRCLQTITFMQPLRRVEERFTCPYCKVALRSQFVPRDGHYGPHVVVVGG